MIRIVFVKKKSTSEQCLSSSSSEIMSLDSRHCNCDQVENLVWNNDLEADKCDLWFTEKISVLNFTEANSVLNITEETSVLNLNHTNSQFAENDQVSNLKFVNYHQKQRKVNSRKKW